MKIREILYEMANLQPQFTGLGLALYVGPEQSYGTSLPHQIPRVKIRTQFGEIPLTIPQSNGEIPEVPKSIKNRELYYNKIPRKVLKSIQQYVTQHRIPLSDFYYQKISEKEMKQQIGYK